MLLDSHTFLANQIMDLENVKARFIALSSIYRAKLQHKPSKRAWSVIECVNHLLLANEFYLVQIIDKVNTVHSEGKTGIINSFYSPGLLGNYLAKRFGKIGDSNSNLTAHKKTVPKIKRILTEAEIDEIINDFIMQLNFILHQLKSARNVDLKKNKVNFIWGFWIKIELGNTFCLVVNHALRHVNQMEALLEEKR